MKGLALFLMVIPFVRFSQDRPLQPSTGRQHERDFITVLGTKNAGKNEIDIRISFFIHILTIY